MELLDRLFLPIVRALRGLRLLLGVAIVLVFGFGWPTLYRYEQAGDALVRINRVTGRAWVYSTKWGEIVWWPISDRFR